MKNFIRTAYCVVSDSLSSLKPMLVLLMLMFVISPATSNASDFYKWTDENGKVHYGSQRPEKAQAERMDLYVPEPASKPESKISVDGEETNQAQEEDVEGEKERLAYCKTERQRLNLMKNNAIIHEKDASGKAVRMSKKEHTKRMGKIKANIIKYCK